MPVRGFGAKKVVFSGMRTPASAAARIWSTVTGRSSTAASTVPLYDVRGDRRRVVAIAELGVLEHRHNAGVEARRVDRPNCLRHLGEARRELGARHQQGQPLAVDETERTFLLHGAFEGDDPLAVVGTGRTCVEPAGETLPEVDVGDAGDHPVDRLHPELLGRKLHDERHDRAGAGIFSDRGGSLRCIRRCGLEAMVAVGEHQRCVRDRGGDRVEARGGIDPEQLVQHAVAVARHRRRLVSDREQIGQALAE